MRRATGTYTKLGNFDHFVPNPLPPQEPLLDLSGELFDQYGRTMLRIGQLNEMARRLPDVDRFVRAYIIKEAMLSSAIEGIHTTLLEVFTQPLERHKPNKETQLVLNYTHALEKALEMIYQQGLPLVSRVILGAHEVLMQVGEGDSADPGQYRKQGVRVGNLVPAPAPKVPSLMSDLEKYINTDTSLPPLIKAGLAHVQFETIHPFLDGNGRIGRLLIVLMLMYDNVLVLPILYPSYYFKKSHAEYYRLLDRVRSHGEFEEWVLYYLRVLEASCDDAYQRAKDIENLEKDIRQALDAHKVFHNKHVQVHQMVTVLFQYPLITIKDLSHHLKKSYNTTSQLVEEFLALGILTEVTTQKRHKVYRFDKYLQLLEKEYPVQFL